jgi:hypothetical protein
MKMKILIGVVEPMQLTLGVRSGGAVANGASTSQAVSFQNTRLKRMRKMNLRWKWLIKIRKIK